MTPKLIFILSAAGLLTTGALYASTATLGKITYGINAPVTLDMVKQVKLGMTHEQVRKIMGRPGTIPYHRPLANEQHGTAEGWLSDDLNLSASYLYGELVAKEVQDDDLYPKGVKIESLSAELTGEQLVDVMCKHVQKCIEMRASEREEAAYRQRGN